MLALARLMATRRRRRAPIRDGSTASMTKRKVSPCKYGADSRDAKRMKPDLTVDELPEDILQQILSLLPIQDAARAACVCRGFLRAWRYYPELVFSAKTLGLNEYTCIQDRMVTDIVNKIDGVLQDRSSIGLKRLKFQLGFCCKMQAHSIDHWLDAAVTPWLEELTLELPRDDKMEYKFPCELLSDEKGCLIQSLFLHSCIFHLKDISCFFRSLKTVHFSWVHITTEELGNFFSNSLALEQLELRYCHDLAYLKIPCMQQQLKFLSVRRCNILKIIESAAPNLSTFYYEGRLIQFLLGDSRKLKNISLSIYPWSKLFFYARSRLPTVAPHLETLFLLSADEMTPPTLGRIGMFLHLKYIELVMVGPRRLPGYIYEYQSLVTFLNDSPALEAFVLHMEDSCVPTSDNAFDPSKLKELPKHRHENIKHMTITGFVPTTGVMQLIFHVLENATSFECLTLDFRTRGFEKELVECVAQDRGSRDFKKWKRCYSRERPYFRRRMYPDMEHAICLSAVKEHIQGRVPSSVELKVLY